MTWNRERCHFSGEYEPVLGPIWIIYIKIGLSCPELSFTVDISNTICLVPFSTCPYIYMATTGTTLFLSRLHPTDGVHWSTARHPCPHGQLALSYRMTDPDIQPWRQSFLVLESWRVKLKTRQHPCYLPREQSFEWKEWNSKWRIKEIPSHSSPLFQ